MADLTHYNVEEMVLVKYSLLQQSNRGYSITIVVVLVVFPFFF